MQLTEMMEESLIMKFEQETDTERTLRSIKKRL